MECPKCNGMLRLERLSDFFFAFYTWNCINCGAIIDKTISHNRRKSRATKSAKVAPKVLRNGSHSEVFANFRTDFTPFR